MKATLLTVSLYDIEEHAQKFMQHIGVSYQLAVPQTLFDCWKFYMCEYDPEKLPSFVTVRNNINPKSHVGFGLSSEKAAVVSKWMLENGFAVSERDL